MGVVHYELYFSPADRYRAQLVGVEILRDAVQSHVQLLAKQFADMAEATILVELYFQLAVLRQKAFVEQWEDVGAQYRGDAQPQCVARLAAQLVCLGQHVVVVAQQRVHSLHQHLARRRKHDGFRCALYQRHPQLLLHDAYRRGNGRLRNIQLLARLSKILVLVHCVQIYKLTHFYHNFSLRPDKSKKF